MFFFLVKYIFLVYFNMNKDKKNCMLSQMESIKKYWKKMIIFFKCTEQKVCNKKITILAFKINEYIINI
jgi:hypothetical protein